MIDVARYKSMGYSDEDITEAITELKTNQLQESFKNTQSNSAQVPYSNTLVSGLGNQENLIKWQLELDSILERIEHILKGDKPTTINGSLVFLPGGSEHDQIFNEFGVAEIMRILSMYLNRNTILSNYDDETINWKVLDFGNEISDLIFMKYQEMGLDCIEKMKRYPMIVRELVDMIHSAYLRAWRGGERDSLRQARTISQTEALTQFPMSGNTGGMKQRSLFNPMRLFKGKFY